MASKSKKVEAVASKSIDAVAKEIQNLQQKSRETLSQIDGAFIEKQEELFTVVEAIKEKTAELEELHGKEQIILNMERLQEELADAKHSHERALRQLGIEHEDKVAEQERVFQARVIEEAQKIKDAKRARRIEQEDEDRQRKLAFEATERGFLAREEQIGAKEVELGSFEERVNKEIGKAKGMAENKAKGEIREMQVRHDAVNQILEAKLQQAITEIDQLKLRLESAETTAKLAQDKAAAIATAALDKDAGKQALQAVSELASQHAAGGSKR